MRAVCVTDKVELVKEIIVNLAKDLQAQKAPLSRVPVESFYRSEQTVCHSFYHFTG